MCPVAERFHIVGWWFIFALEVDTAQASQSEDLLFIAALIGQVHEEAEKEKGNRRKWKKK